MENYHQVFYKFSSGLVSHTIICEILVSFAKNIFQEQLLFCFDFRSIVMLTHAAKIPFNVKKNIVIKKGRKGENLAHV